MMKVTNTRERILSMGGAGAGKTYDLLTIARLAINSGSDAQFHLIDTDNASGAVLMDEEFRSLWNEDCTATLNVHIYPVSSWDELLATLTTLQGKLDQGKFVTKGVIRDQDWLSIDMLTPTYMWVQDWYTHQVFGQGYSDYFLDARKKLAAKGGEVQGFEGNKDWGIINPQYGLLQDRILRTPGNIYCTAEVKALDAQRADKATKATFGPHGVIPAGQKRTPHIFSTIVWKTMPRAKVRQVITIKDRGGREWLTGDEVSDFGREYLIDVAGWTAGLSAAEKLAAAKAKRAVAKVAVSA